MTDQPKPDARRTPRPLKNYLSHTVQQRTNALISAAKAIRKYHQQPVPEIDWDAAIARLKTMLDQIDKNTDGGHDC